MNLTHQRVDNRKELYQRELELLKGRARHPYLHHFLPLLKEEDYVLDLGCGLLVNALYLKDNGMKVVGMDISLEMLGEMKNTGLPLVCADGFNLPFKNDRFGGLLLIDIIEHLPRGKLNGFMRETKRVLKNGAVIFLHIPLEGSLSYRLLSKRGLIWPKNPNHLHDYTLKEITNLIKRRNCKVLWEFRENGVIYALRTYLREVKFLIILSRFLGRYLEDIFTAAYTACISFERKITK